MKEYRVIEANGAANAEAIMNEMAKDGWEVLGVTYWTYARPRAANRSARRSLSATAVPYWPAMSTRTS